MPFHPIQHKCAKCHITSKEDENICFHRFPLPGKYGTLRARIWAEYCYPAGNWSDLKILKSLHKQHKMLCSKHFDDSSYTCGSRKRMNIFAIPIGTNDLLLKLRQSQETDKVDSTATSNCSKTMNKIRELEIRELEEKLTTEITPTEPCISDLRTEYQATMTETIYKREPTPTPVEKATEMETIYIRDPTPVKDITSNVQSPVEKSTSNVPSPVEESTSNVPSSVEESTSNVPSPGEESTSDVPNPVVKDSRIVNNKNNLNKMKENRRKCIKCGASPSENPSIVLHRFPRPGTTNSLRCELWAKYCFPNKQWFSTAFQNKVHSEHRMLCTKHFSKKYFVDAEGKRMFKCAVPDDECDEILSNPDKEPEPSNSPQPVVLPKPLLDSVNILNSDQISNPDEEPEPSNSPQPVVLSKPLLNNVNILNSDQILSNPDKEPEPSNSPQPVVLPKPLLDNMNILNSNQPEEKTMDPKTTLSTQDLLNIEWLKVRIRTLWNSPKYCALCLSSEAELFGLSMEFTNNEVTSTKPLREVVNYVFNFEIEDYSPSDSICVQCAEKTIQSYIFITNTKKTYQILDNCLNDMHSKVDDINNTLDDNLKYEDSNVMIVIEYDDETYEKINQLNSGNCAVLTDEPNIVTKSNTSSDKLVNLNVTQATDKENTGPVVIQTPRVVKHPRKKEIIVKNNEINVEEKVPTPNMTLKEGKIVIEPLVLNSHPSTPRFNTYSCNSCTDIFTTYRSLKEHEKVKHNSVIYKCRYCVKIYNTQQYLDVHYSSSHGKSRCRFCKDLFDSESLNTHLKEKHPKLIYACTDCSLVYYNYEKLYTHIKSSHWGQNTPTADKKQCVMCLKSLKDNEVFSHRCKFLCLECPEIPCIHYSYLMSYREQILNHSQLIKCIDCDYTTKRKEHLIGHVNREHLDYHPFECDDCGTQFYTKLSLKTHMTQFHQDLKCQYCDTEFKNPKLLQRHRQGCKLISRKYRCVKCVASFDTFVELEKHTNVYHTMFVFPCTLCTKEFPHKAALKEHHARIHSGIQQKKRRKIIECTICDLTFKNIKEMLEHEKLHSPDETFPCKVCPKVFSNLKKIYIHKQRHYSDRVKCRGCNKSVAGSYLVQHETLCRSLKKNDSKNICEVCGKVFNARRGLKAHQQVCHSQSEPCVHCGRMIKVSSMKKHVELKHAPYAVPNENDSKVVQLTCEECGYATRKRADFENHINKIHLKVKPYSCELCGKTFCGKSRLAEHMKTHSTAKTCFCSYCGKKFANKVCLKMHVRRHTGESPYECNICYEKFRSSSIMKTHRLKKHQDKTVACPLCDAMYHLVAEMRFHVKKAHWKSTEPFDYKKIVPEQFHHLFHDRRLQKLGDDSVVMMENQEYTIVIEQ